MNTKLTRRRFLWLGTGAAALSGCRAVRRVDSPNSKLDIGVIGVANQGQYNLNHVASENIVALCDVDSALLAAAAEKHPQAQRFTDFRRMLDRVRMDAVVVSTPDHTHAVAAVWAIDTLRHVYCEKPLARTVSEVRVITERARRRKRVTQMGTQIHAGPNYRRVVELVQSGAVGPVREVHVWVGATFGGKELPVERPPVPPTLDYDLWLGPVEPRPYSPEYVPFHWRNWWAFGGGVLADLGCHFMDLPHWALDLRSPLSAEVLDGPPVHPESAPPWLVVRYEYPARGAQPPVRLIWYHGGRAPDLLQEDEDYTWRSGVAFVGERGRLLADYNRHVLLPRDSFRDFERPTPFIPESIGHHREWIEACKTGGPTTCSFDYSGPLTEAVLLGNVVYRAGCRLEWNSERMRAANCPAAEQFIRHQYRRGWRI